MSTKFNIGDKVCVVRRYPFKEQGLFPPWVPSMEAYLDKVSTVVNVNNFADIVKLSTPEDEIGGFGFWFASKYVEHVNKNSSGAQMENHNVNSYNTNSYIDKKGNLKITLDSLADLEALKESTLSMRSQYKRDTKESAFEVGDTVRVTRAAKSYEGGWPDTWLEAMDDWVGKKCVIERVKRDGSILLTRPELSKDTSFFFPFFVLELLMPADASKAFEWSEKNRMSEVMDSLGLW